MIPVYPPGVVTAQCKPRASGDDPITYIVGSDADS